MSDGRLTFRDVVRLYATGIHVQVHPLHSRIDMVRCGVPRAFRLESTIDLATLQLGLAPSNWGSNSPAMAQMYVFEVRALAILSNWTKRVPRPEQDLLPPRSIRVSATDGEAGST